MVRSTGLIHSRTRRKIPLIADPEAIRELTGRWNYKARPRCGRCKRPTVALKADYGRKAKPRYREVARYCDECEVIFPKRRVVVSTYE